MTPLHVVGPGADVTPVAPGHGVTDASALRLAPGEWPDLVAMLADDGGEGALYRRFAPLGRGKAFAGYEYWSGPLRLDILND